ncbi:MAG: hypothetical protein WKG01_28960, partial [Kofleriaceae bacterium]
MKTLLGIALVAVHVLAFVHYVPACRRPELVIELRDPVHGAARPLAKVPDGLAKRIQIDATGDAPGLVHEHYAVRYRGVDLLAGGELHPAELGGA